LPTTWIGKVGLTFAPGKQDSQSLTGPWDRDLGADIERLSGEYSTAHLVCLLEDYEFAAIKIE
jgi:hypothetical protein